MLAALALDNCKHTWHRTARTLPHSAYNLENLMPSSHEIVPITPDWARDVLASHNTRNRTISPVTVKTYARLMREGRWIYNGDPIQFAEDGTLLNGQHRLMAIVESDTIQPTMVVRGLLTRAGDTMDQQRRRSAGDVLAIHGIKQGNTVAGIARALAAWDSGARGPSLMGGGQWMLASEELLDFLAKEPLILQAAEVVRLKTSQQQAPSRSMGVLWVLAHRANPGLAEEFHRRLTTGEMLAAGDPVLALRRYWANLNDKTRGSLRTGSAFVYLNSGVRAWNAWVWDEPMHKMTWKTTNIPEVRAPKSKTGG